jgi:AcrR family transcriptional regulator
MRRTKEDAEKTRELILKTAADLFSEKGVVRTTLLDIARVAHLTRGAIYWHFQNKLEIFDALYERLHQPFVQMILEDMNEDHPEPLGQLRDLCIKLFLDLRDNREKRQMIKLFLIKCDYEGELAPYKKSTAPKRKRGWPFLIVILIVRENGGF